jgi:plasmid replication initiation protein
MEQDLLFMPSGNKKELEIIKKDNRIIEAKYKLSIYEQRLILAVLGMIKTEDTELEYYKINIKEIAELHGLQNSKDLYAQIHNAGEQLLVKPLDISTGKRTIKVTWLNYINYKEGEGAIIVDFHKSLKPYLLQLKANFTQYQLAAVVNFKNTYSIRFYEFLKMRQNQGKGGQFFIRYAISELKEILGISLDKYPQTKDLRVYVIEPALKEIDSQTDLAIVDVQYIKQGRSISEIVVYAEPKKQRAIPIPKQPETVENENHPLIDTLVELGFSFENAKHLKVKYGVKKIERNIAYTLATKQAGEVINSIPAYISKAVEYDWGNAWEKEKVKEADRKKKMLLDEAKQEQEKKEKEAKAKIDNQRAFDEFQALPEDEKAIIIGQILSSKGDILRNDYKTRGLKSLLLKGEIIAFIKSSWDLK